MVGKDKRVCNFCHTMYEIDTTDPLDKEPTNIFNQSLKAQRQYIEYSKTPEYKERQKKAGKVLIILGIFIFTLLIIGFLGSIFQPELWNVPKK